MEHDASFGIFSYFSEIPDPRVHRTRRHLLINVLAIALFSVICGGEAWEDMHLFGVSKSEWLSTFLNLRRGVPSADTFRRVFQALDAKAFSSCFRAWVEAISGSMDGKLIAIDGKTLRGSFDKATGSKALHLVHAWCESNKMLLAQVATDEKSNEISAIPKLIEMLNIRGATVTIDAMGCQKSIAKDIVDKGANYVFTLKGNQGNLHKSVENFFDKARSDDFKNVAHDVHQNADKGHGRIEVRRVFSTQQIESIDELKKWESVRSIIMIESTQRTGEKETFERRYAISSHIASAERLGDIIRGHWGVESTLHWTLDVTFSEDAARIRDNNAAENVSTLRKIALNLAKNEPSQKKLSMKQKRKMAGWREDYLLTLIALGLSQNSAK